MNAREAIVALNMLPKIGPVRVKKMVQSLGSPEAILKASFDQLLEIKGLGPSIAKIVTSWQDHVDVTMEIQEAKSRGIRVLTQQDEEYPEALLNTYDPPLVLYVWGRLKPVDDHGVSIVGSRRYTHYGQQTARQLSFQLASAGVSIVSGLARGIDTFAHEGALAANGRTIAVIGSGLAQIYPPENLTLAQKIADGSGAVVSEFAMHKKPDKKNFPMRNRIVAGWADGVLVIECPKWSGSLITANLANDMGKSIYAVPGQIDAPNSAGCNQLIRSGASLVTCAEDILADREMLPLFKGSSASDLPVNPALLSLSDKEKMVHDALSHQPQLMDELMVNVEMSLPELSVTLLQLELKKVVQQVAGQRYVRKVF